MRSNNENSTCPSSPRYLTSNPPPLRYRAFIATSEKRFTSNFRDIAAKPRPLKSSPLLPVNTRLRGESERRERDDFVYRPLGPPAKPAVNTFAFRGRKRG